MRTSEFVDPYSGLRGNELVEVPCWWCDGSGAGNGSGKLCSHCQGTGHYMVKVSYARARARRAWRRGGPTETLGAPRDPGPQDGLRAVQAQFRVGQDVEVTGPVVESRYLAHGTAGRWTNVVGVDVDGVIFKAFDSDGKIPEGVGASAVLRGRVRAVRQPDSQVEVVLDL